MSRKPIKLKTKLASALCHMLRADERGHFVRIISHDEAKRMTEDQIIARFDFHHHPIPKAHGGPDTHWNLDPLPGDDHDRITAKVTIPFIAKGKRITAKQEEFRRRLLAKDASEPKPKSRWASRPMRGRTTAERRA